MGRLTSGLLYAAGVLVGMAAAAARETSRALGVTAAAEYLYDRFPQLTSTIGSAVVGTFRAIAAVGTRYRQGGAGYSPQWQTLPDVRPAILAAGEAPPLEPGERTRPRVIHHLGVVEIISPTTGEVVGRIPFDNPAPDTLQRDILETILPDEVQDEVDRITESDTFIARHGGATVRVNIIGAYVGY